MSAGGPSRALLAAAALTAVAAMALPTPAPAAEPGQVTQPVHVTRDDTDPTRLYSTPDIAVDPGDPLRMAVSFMDARKRECGVMTSEDGGITWVRPDASVAPDRFPYCLHLQFGTYSNPVAFGRDGTLYHAFNGWSEEDGGWSRGNVSVLLGRSDDLGRSWEISVVRDARGKEGEAVESNGPMSWVEIDSETGDADVVYVGWNTAFPGQRVETGNRLAYQPFMAVSTDGGRTFSEPVNLAADAFSDPALRAEILADVPPPADGASAPAAGSKAAEPDQVGNFGGWGARMTVDGEGTVYAEWSSVTANLSGAPAAHYVSKSTDRGGSWIHTRVSPVSEAIYTFVPGGIGWTEEGGPDGTLHVVYDANGRPEIGAYGDVFYTRSTDGGLTWTEPRMLTDEDDAQRLVGQYYGALSVAPDGRVDVAWWDARHDPGVQGFDVYYTSSFDNGDTWSPHTRVTDRTISRKVGIWGFNFDMTSPPALASTEAYAVMAWDDTTLTGPGYPDNADLGGGLQDVFLAAVQYEELGAGGSDAWKAVLAAVVGVTAVGLVLMLATALRSDRWRAPRAGSDTSAAAVRPGGFPDSG